jgi:hypothetical protein
MKLTDKLSQSLSNLSMIVIIMAAISIIVAMYRI